MIRVRISSQKNSSDGQGNERTFCAHGVQFAFEICFRIGVAAGGILCVHQKYCGTFMSPIACTVKILSSVEVVLAITDSEKEELSPFCVTKKIRSRNGPNKVY